MANPFPFTAGQVLTAAQMNGIGESLSFTPTYTNFSLGNGSVLARYVRVQKLVYVFVLINCGSTSAFTGTQMSVTKPITSAGEEGVQGTVSFFDASTGSLIFGPIRYASTTTVVNDLYNAASTYLTIGFTNASTPFTLAAGDVIGMNYVYEAA
jgi:hypothetical protein